MNRKLPVLSASQISTFVSCQRKWSFKYIHGLPDYGSSSADSGKKFHAYLEHWLKSGTTPGNADREAAMASAALKYLPAPSANLRVEEAFEFTVDGVPFRGFKDLVYYDGDTLVVHDHKSTSDLKWAKTADDLRKDTQAILYARHAFEEADQVALSWLYVTREKYPKVHPVRVNIDWDTVAKSMGPIISTGHLILDEYNIRRNANELPPNLSACEAYGGCPYKDSCEITARDRAKAALRQYNNEADKEMGFRDRIKAQSNAEAPAPAPAPAPETTRPSMRERLASTGFGSAVNPPPGPEPLVTPAAEEPAKPKRGRPKKVAETAPAPETPESGGGLSNTHYDRKIVGYTLCINCLPDSPFTPFTDILKIVLPEVQAANDVADYRLLEYGKGVGVGVLNAALYTHLESNMPTGYLFVDAQTPEGRDCLTTLTRFALAVIRRV